MPFTDSFSLLVATLLQGGAPTPPAGIFLAAFTADPTVGGAFTNELTGDGYARIDVSARITAPAADGTFSNSQAVTFASPSVPWSTVTHVALCDALAAGTMSFPFALVANITPDVGAPLSFAIGKLTWDMSG